MLSLSAISGFCNNYYQDCYDSPVSVLAPFAPFTRKFVTAKRSIHVVVPAAGVGSRMLQDQTCSKAAAQSDSKPKQYLNLATSSKSGKELSILEATLNKLSDNDAVESIILALHRDDRWFKKLTLAEQVRQKVIVIEGGATRFESVSCGLDYLSCNAKADPLVIVHDAARPCFCSNKLTELIELSERTGRAALLAAKVVDTVKHLRKPFEPALPATTPSEKLSESSVDPALNLMQTTINRDALWLAHTPQIAPLNWLREAFAFAQEQAYEVTDECSALEYHANHLSKTSKKDGLTRMPLLVEDTLSNLKITTIDDLRLARLIYNKDSST